MNATVNTSEHIVNHNYWLSISNSFVIYAGQQKRFVVLKGDKESI